MASLVPFASFIALRLSNVRISSEPNRHSSIHPIPSTSDSSVEIQLQHAQIGKRAYLVPPSSSVPFHTSPVDLIANKIQSHLRLHASDGSTSRISTKLTREESDSEVSSLGDSDRHPDSDDESNISDRSIISSRSLTTSEHTTRSFSDDSHSTDSLPSESLPRPRSHQTDLFYEDREIPQPFNVNQHSPTEPESLKSTPSTPTPPELSRPDSTDISVQKLPYLNLQANNTTQETIGSHVRSVNLASLHNDPSKQSAEELFESEGESFSPHNTDHALLISEEPFSNSPRVQVQVLRPMQVRRMPFIFHVLMITCISMIGFGSYAAYDAIAAVQEPLMKDLGLTLPQFGYLYSVYALPNILLVIFGGTLVDKLGAHTVGIATTASVALGALLVAMAPSLGLFGNRGRFAIMLIGRFIFGVGAESSYVVQNSMCVKWFFGDYLATAMSITAAGTRLGSICSFVFAPKLAAQKNYILALWAAVGACVLSVFAVFGYMALRSWAKKSLLADKFDANSLEIDAIPPGLTPRTSPRNMGVEMGTLDDQGDEEDVPLESEDPENGYRSESPPAVRRTLLGVLAAELKQTLQQIRGFSLLFWGCAILLLFTYGITLAFRAVASDAMVDRFFTKTPGSANFAMAIIDITGLISAPLAGWIIDYTLKIGWMTLFGNSLSAVAFVLLLLPFSPYFAMVVLGLSSTVVLAGLYPSIPLITSPELEGLAFGVTSSVINLGNLLINFVAGHALTAGWLYMCLLFIALSLVSVGITLWWIIRDAKSGSPVLNRSTPS